MLDSISASGRFVVFDSLGSGLVAGDTNGVWDVFVRDMVTGTTQRVSVSSEEAQADGYSWGIDISADGRYVLFGSVAANLVPHDANEFEDVFIRDRLLGTTRVVHSVPAIGTLALSGNGRYIAWASPGHGNVVARYDLTTHHMVNTFGGDETWMYDISYSGRAVLFLGDRWLIWHPVSGRKFRFDQALHGGWANRNVSGVALSGDGRRVLFDSRADNLVRGDTNGRRDVFVRNLVTGRTVRIDRANDGGQPNGGSRGLGLSHDGRFQLFASNATNLVPGDTNEAYDIFRYDRIVHTTKRCTVSSSGEQANTKSRKGVLSGNGEFVAFRSAATNLVAFPTPAGGDIFIRGPGC